MLRAPVLGAVSHLIYVNFLIILLLILNLPSTHLSLNYLITFRIVVSSLFYFLSFFGAGC